ncbi:MAG: hypothetical protein ACI9MJ_000948 [Alphaproteobacteria bacterium]|jgi:hypothetical protein
MRVGQKLAGADHSFRLKMDAGLYSSGGAVLAVPMFFMEGIVRTGLAVLLLGWGVYTLWKRNAGGWKLEAEDDHFAEMYE